MKRALVVAAVFAIGSAGCGSKSPDGPSDQPTVFTVALKAANETPAVSGAESNAAGTAVITIDATRDSAGNVTSGSIEFKVTMNSFPDGSSAILAHIHNAPVGTTGAIFVDTGLRPGTAIQMPNGSGTFSFTVEPGVDKINQILGNPAGFYFNVHTPLNPNGAIRGQLQ